MKMAVKDEQIIPPDSTIDDDNTIRTGRNDNIFGTLSEKILLKPAGTLWTTVAHIITAVIGSGVLSLSWSTAKLGWIEGPIALISFAFVTYVSSALLADCYRSPDPVTGTRNRTYTDAVRVILGEKHAWVCGIVQYVNFYGTAVAYVVTTATCMGAIQKANCYHKQGRGADCDEFGGNFYMLLFGLVQVLMSQIPDFQSMVLVSVVAAIMSFFYSSIGFGLGIAQVIENGKIAGNVTGIPAASVTDKLLQTFQAIGDIAFAYPYALILLEIQDTVKSPPAENKITKRASAIATLVTGFFYLGCGCFGYAAFGNDTPGNLLTGFGFYEPYWLIGFANACIIIHVLGGYQLYSQPVFAFVERGLTEKFLDNQFVKRNHELKLPLLPVFRFNMLRLCFRTTYVATTIAIAVLFPYFNEIMGATGALNLWPLAIYFPVEMYIVQRKVETWSRKWVVLEIFNGVLMILSLVALVASVAGLIEAKMKE